MIAVREALDGLSVRGRCLLAAGLALAVCAVVLGQRDLLRVAVFLVALPLAAVAVVARTRYRLSCTRSLDPSRVQAGTATTVRLRLDNVSRLPSGTMLMEDALPHALGGRPRFVLDRVEPRGVRDVSYPVLSQARGRFTVGPLSVRLTDPFGLCELTRSFATRDALVVTPATWPLPAVRLGGDRAGGGEATARAVASSGSDDAATREYRHGDDLRKVHWRSTARVGELMVRREEQPFQSRATLLLDGRAGAHRGEGTDSSFETAVSALASVGVALARAGFTLQLLREDGQELTPAGLPVTESVVLDALATVSPSPSATLEPAVVRLRRATSGGVLVAVLGRLDVGQAERLARLRSGSGVCIAVLLDPASWSGAGAGAAGDGQEARRARAVLVATGWRVLPLSRGTSLEELWPLAAGRTTAARYGGSAPVERASSSVPAADPSVVVA